MHQVYIDGGSHTSTKYALSLAQNPDRRWSPSGTIVMLTGYFCESQGGWLLGMYGYNHTLSWMKVGSRDTWALVWIGRPTMELLCWVKSPMYQEEFWFPPHGTESPLTSLHSLFLCGP